jgi:ADP-ribose pyrophosphatase
MPLDLEALIAAWGSEGGETILETPIYTLRSERRSSPRTGETRPYYIIDSPDWVNVIPITPEGEVIMVAQWRHGTSTRTLEIPSGLLEQDERPEDAGLRELREETGYTAERVTVLGCVRPNHALFSNRCTTVLAEGVTYAGPVELDPGEDIAVLKIPLAEVKALIADGTIDHALALVAFYWLELHNQKQ